MKPYAFGIDLGGTTVKVGLFRTTGELVFRHEIPTRKENNGAMILPDIAAVIKSDMKMHDVAEDELEGIGLDVPGPVLKDSIVNRCVNLGWGVFNVAEEITRLTGIENVKVNNDANVAALGEMWMGGGKGYENVVMVTLGTGVGGGIVIGGKIISGINGAGGELGHMQINAREKNVCGCGKCGHLEQYCSATGMVRVAKDMLKESDRPSALRDIEELTAKDLFDCAKEGDGLAIEIVEKVCEILGRTLALVACVVDPDVFVIGGGVSKAGGLLTETVSKYYRQAAFHAAENTKIVLAELGNDAGMYGAVRMLI